MKSIISFLTVLLFSVSVYPQCGQDDFRKLPYLIYDNNPSEMKVLWQLTSTRDCLIKWGLTDQYEINAVQTLETGSQQDEHQHIYTIGSLTPSTKYYYKVFVADPAGQEYTSCVAGSFFTAPDPIETDVTFYAYGDTRGSETSTSQYHDAVNEAVLNEIGLNANSQTFLIHTGDWSYNEDENIWDRDYFNLTHSNAIELKLKLAVMGAKGNHEFSGATYEKYWPYSYSNFNALGFCYSFNYGPVHICYIDLQDEDATLNADQKDWIENDFAATEKEWKVMAFHAPGYSNGYHLNNLDARDYLQPLAVDRGVQLVLCGHNHYYAHWQVDGVHHLTLGGGGAPLYPPSTGLGEIIAISAYHFARLSIENDILNVRVIGIYGETLEDFSIPKSLNICNNNNVLWNKDLANIGSVRVCNGSTLTITSNVSFSADSKIIVERGAKLILDGGTLTNACEGLWRGIEVWGNINQPQNPQYQGWVEIINGGIIENAMYGIRTIHAEDDETGEGEILDPTTSGGIVFANTARFINNKTAVRFYSYPQTSMSNFTECEFETNPDLISGVTPDYFMWLDHISGIDITDCSFNNTTETDYLHSGIYAVDATFYIEGRCIAGDPCTDWDYGWFRKMDYAVRVVNTNTQYYPDIRHTDFSLCKRGIYISNADGARVTSCLFWMPAVEGSVINDYYGLYLNNSFSYHVEKNDFMGPAPGAGGIGMYINNSGAHWNQIYNNSCTGLNYGTIAYGLNRNPLTSVGLCIECNDYDDNKYDIVVNGLMGGSGHGIAHDQGQLGPNDTLPAGNTFTQNYAGLIYNYKNTKSLAFINYVYHALNNSQDKINPDPYYSIQTMNKQSSLGTTYDKEFACPSKLEIGGGGGEGERIEMEYAIDQMELKEDQLELLVDGGDTYFMNLDVVTSTPPEATTVYNELMGESPYLSDTVMKSAIYKENVLPNAMVRDVLVANPQSAKNTEIMDAIDERFEPMPEWMKEQVMEGVSIKGAKETLESEIRFWDRKRSDHFEKMYQHFRKDTVNVQASLDSLEALLEQDNRLESKYRLAFVSMEQGAWSEGQAILDLIPTEFDLSPLEESVHQDYIILFTVLAQLNGNLPEAGSAEASELEALAAKDVFYPGACARNILYAAGCIDYQEPVILPEEELKSSEVNGNNTINQSGNPDILKVFPNPAGDYFIIDYNTEDYTGDISIKASDLSGRLLFTNTCSLKRDQVVLDVTAWITGVYNISLLVNGKIIKSEKISIK